MTLLHGGNLRKGASISQLDLLHAYADTWGLTVNIDKTKAVNFRQSPSNQVYPTPMYDSAPIEIVNSST